VGGTGWREATILEIPACHMKVKRLLFSVMALYPQTTCFYKAVVNALPTTATEDYEVLFEDPSYAEGFSPPLPVAQRYVLAIRDRKGHSHTHSHSHS